VLDRWQARVSVAQPESSAACDVPPALPHPQGAKAARNPHAPSPTVCSCAEFRFIGDLLLYTLYCFLWRKGAKAHATGAEAAARCLNALQLVEESARAVGASFSQAGRAGAVTRRSRAGAVVEVALARGLQLRGMQGLWPSPVLRWNLRRAGIATKP